MSKRSIAALAVFLVMAVLGGLCIGWASRTLLDPIDKVEFDITDTFGDPSAAEGLKLEAAEDSGLQLRHLYSTVYGAGGPETAVTHEFPRAQDVFSRRYSILYINADLENAVKIQEFLKGEMAKLSAGERKTVSIRAKDFYDYYPISVHWEHGTSYMDFALFTDGDGDILLYRQFQEAFRVPVPGDLIMDFLITSQTKDFGSIEFLPDQSDPDMYRKVRFDFNGLLFDGAYYIASYNRAMALPEDLDQVILRIPVGEYDESVTADLKGPAKSITEGPLPEKMERWYVPETPFVPADYQALALSEDQKILYIQTSDGNTTRVAALKEGADKPFEIDIPDLGSFNNNFFLSGSDLIIYKQGEAFHCVSPRPDGSLSLMSFPTGGSDRPLALVFGRTGYYKVASGGSRLAVCAVTLDSEKASTGGSPPYTGIFTQVYTKEGLAYSSAMHSSITDAAGYPRGDQQTWTTNGIHIQSFGWK